MKRVLAFGVGLWAAASLWAGMTYETQAVTFSEKSGSGVTPATITMSGGWALASLTNQSGTAIDFRPLSDSAANATTFTPDQNIKSSEGPWVATFRPPAGAVLDFISLPIMLYSGATNSTSGSTQGPNASTTLTVTLKLNGEAIGQPVTLPVTGDNTFTARTTARFDFAPQAVETVEVRIVQNSDTGMNAGLTGLGAGLYAVADEAIAFSGKTATSATLTEGWSLSDRSCDLMTTTTGSGTAIASNATILTPNMNVGNGETWSLTFAAPTLEPVREVGFDVVMFNSAGIAQGNTTQRTVQFTVEALDADGSTVLDSATTAADLLLTSSGTIEAATNGLIRLAFATPVAASKFRITAQRGTNTATNANLGCYYGLSALRILRQATVVTGEAPAADTRATIWVNPTAWATHALRVGAIYLGNQALPRVTAGSATVTAEVARVAVESFTVQADTGVTQQVIEAESYAGTAGVEVSLEGAVDPTALRPGETAQGATISTDAGFALRVGEVAFQTDPGVAVAYAGAGAQVDLAEAVWWHSASAGAAATQGALPNGVEAQLWVEAGGVLRLADGAQAWSFVPEAQAGTIEVPEGRVARFAQVIDPGICAPMMPEGVAMRLGGTLEMEGFVPALELVGEGAQVASLGMLAFGRVTAEAGAQLKVTAGEVTVMAPASEVTYRVSGGGLALLAQDPVEVAAMVVDGIGALTLGTEVSVRTAEVEAESSLTAAPETLAQVHSWSGEGQVLIAAETPGEAAFVEAEGSALQVALVADEARTWWLEKGAGQVNFGAIGAGASASGVQSPIVEALQQKVFASSLPIPEGTRQFAYTAVGTDGQPRAASEAEALNAAYLFDLQPTAISAPDEAGTATVAVVYDFGISAMTYAPVEGTTYVLVTAMVRNTPEGEANGADFAAGTTVELRQVAEDGTMVDVEGAEAVANDWQPFGAGEAGSGPVRYFRVPLEHFPRGATALRVVAERQ
ncbi:MAG: hypothetical protein ACI4QJ_02725 [Candidatus Spyradenecus sp.]